MPIQIFSFHSMDFLQSLFKLLVNIVSWKNPNHTGSHPSQWNSKFQRRFSFFFCILWLVLKNGHVFFPAPWKWYGDAICWSMNIGTLLINKNKPRQLCWIGWQQQVGRSRTPRGPFGETGGFVILFSLDSRRSISELILHLSAALFVFRERPTPTFLACCSVLLGYSIVTELYWVSVLFSFGRNVSPSGSHTWPLFFFVFQPGVYSYILWILPSIIEFQYNDC